MVLLRFLTVPAGRWGRGDTKAASPWRRLWRGPVATCHRTSSSPCQRALTPRPPATAWGRPGAGPGWPRRWGPGSATPGPRGTAGACSPRKRPTRSALPPPPQPPSELVRGHWCSPAARSEGFAFGPFGSFDYCQSAVKAYFAKSVTENRERRC